MTFFLRKRGLILLGLLLGGVLATAWRVWPADDGITSEKVLAVTPGMTAAEVEALLGRPPGLYASFVAVEPVPAGAGPGKHWVGSRAGVYVHFDADGRAVARYPLRVVPYPRPGLVERLRRWLGV